MRLTTCGSRIRRCMFAWAFVLGLGSRICMAAPSQPLSVSVVPGQCLFTIGTDGAAVLNAGVAAKVDHVWLHSADYPKCTIAETDVSAELGQAHQWVVEYSGLGGKPNLAYTLRSYRGQPFADIQAMVTNQTGQPVEVEDIRSIESSRGLDLGGPLVQDRVLSDSFSEDRPELRIHDLGDAPHQMHRGVGSQLVYNLQTHRSFFVGALSSERFLTILRLHVGGTSSDPSIQSYEVDSTGTTEMTSENSLRDSPKEDHIELSLPVAPGASLTAERLLVGVDNDPHRQLEAYGDFIRTLHHPRPPGPTPIGWWSWTAYYFGLNQGAALTNAQWLAQNLKPLGYTFFHIDEGYQYSRGEYATPDATLFPDGLGALERKVTALGLTPGIWTAPFEVGQRSWVYQNHQDWLVHNAEGKPIHLGSVDDKEPIYALDVTHPGAQQYLRHTYTVMARDWGVRYFKLDFMEDSAVEGHYFKPNTTALEAQRIGLGLIRDAAGNSVLLDKDGSAMLNPVGYVDEGRISQDTGHTFGSSKDAATGIAARYYMNHNFFTSDPDAFSVSTQTLLRHWHGGDQPLTLDDAKLSIVLSAVSGGMYEIGDDLPTLGSDVERVALVKNGDLLDMARLGRASIPVDLMDYLPEDEQPSIFYLHEDPRQSILTVFNWTDKPRTHSFHPADFALPANEANVLDIFTDKPVSLGAHDTLVVEQPAHSVRVFKLENSAVAPLHPTITAQRLPEGHSGDDLPFSVAASTLEEPVLTYVWDFGDGVTASGATPSHTYTAPGTYSVQVKASFLNGNTAEDHFKLSVTGVMNNQFQPAQKHRFASD